MASLLISRTIYVNNHNCHTFNISLYEMPQCSLITWGTSSLESFFIRRKENTRKYVAKRKISRWHEHTKSTSQVWNVCFFLQLGLMHCYMEHTSNMKSVRSEFCGLDVHGIGVQSSALFGPIYGTANSSSEGKVAGAWTDDSPPSVGKFKSTWCYTSTDPYAFIN
jgi:hypothetical protein